MKAVILAGGLGTRLREETLIKPKPMVEIGDRPILWHILKIYSHFGINEFIICCGYKGYLLKEYFANFYLHDSDVTFKLNSQKVTFDIHDGAMPDWEITLVNTGDNTNTGGRLGRIKNYLNLNEPFCFNYGDGVADVNIKDLISFHINNGKKVTLTAVQPPARFGALELEGDNVIKFIEKPKGDNSWINGGFFILEPSIFEKIDNDSCSWESDVLPQLAEENELIAYKHYGFWQPMDTLRDKNKLNELWVNNKAKWKLWN